MIRRPSPSQWTGAGAAQFADIGARLNMSVLCLCLFLTAATVITGFQPCGDTQVHCDGWTASGWERVPENRGMDVLTARRSGDTIQVGERVRVRVNVTRNLYVDIGMCGRTCTVFHSGGMLENNVGFRVYKTSDANIRSHESEILSPYVGSCQFPLGESLVYVVERVTKEVMAVWLDGNSMRAVSIPISPDQNRLEVHADAGIPEFMDAKVRRLGDALAVGERARLQTKVTRDTRVHIGLCGANCSGVTATGVKDKVVGYATFTTRGGSVLHPRSEIEFGGPDEFKKGDVIVFVVERRSSLEAAVWVESIPDTIIKIQLSPDQDKLNAFALFHEIQVLHKKEEDSSTWVWVHKARGDHNVLLSPPLPVDPGPGLPGGLLCVSVEFRLPVLTEPERRRLETPAGPALLVWGQHHARRRPLVLHGKDAASAMDWVRRDVSLRHPGNVTEWKLAISVRGGVPAAVRKITVCGN